MTAEVAVMNTLGVALAADSAVTIGNGDKKIYRSSEKLFQLSERAPVAIMTNGNANFLGMPWEMIIKVYRKHLGQKTFDKLSDYADHFFRYIESNTRIFPNTIRERHTEILINERASRVQKTISKRLENKDNKSVKTSGLQNQSSAIYEIVREIINIKREDQKIESFSSSVITNFKKKYGKKIDASMQEFFEEYTLPSKTQRAISTLIVEYISRKSFMDSGVIFAGYGEMEYMPALLSYAVEGMVDKNLRYYLEGKKIINHENKSNISSFAQGEEFINLFLEGIDQRYEGYINNAIEQLLKYVSSDLLDSIPDMKKNKHKKEEFIDNMRGHFADSIEDFFIQSEHEHWIPIINMVTSMPKDELAATSEMLVNLAKFRLRISPEKETIGGPIDVALITKGDGFLWIKRKNYFPAELNPHINTN